jgi:hypothetical protein
MSATTTRGAGHALAPRRGRWSPEQREAIAALRELEAEIDRTPTQTIWRASGRQPSERTIRTLFGGSWSAAIKAAGLPPNMRSWIKIRTPGLLERHILTRMREWADEHGRAPTAREWSAAGEIPSVTTVVLRFGSWNNAIRAAGLTPRTGGRSGKRPPGSRGRRGIWTRATIIEALQRDAQRLGRAPTAQEWQRGASTNRPSYATVCNHFGSWRAGLCAAGLADTRPMPERIVEALRLDARRLGRPPRAGDWARMTTDHPSHSTVCHHFGSFEAALRAAGLADERSMPERIIAALIRDTQKRGRSPTAAEWQKATSDHPAAGTVRIYFGTFEAGLRAAGLAKHRPMPGRIIEALIRDAQKRGRPPTAAEWWTATSDHPCALTVRNHFGSFEAGLHAAGLA